MSFKLFTQTGREDTLILSGGNAPETGLSYSALRVARPPAHVMPNNSQAQNYRGSMIGNKQQASIQSRYVSAIAQRKIGSKTTTGAASWVGKSFGA